MFYLTTYILSDDDCYTGSYGEKVFNLLEGWYWISIFSGHFDRDQNARMIVDLNLLVDCVLSIKNNLHPNLVWLKDRQNKVLNMPGYSDLKHILMENSQHSIQKNAKRPILITPIFLIIIIFKPKIIIYQH